MSSSVVWKRLDIPGHEFCRLHEHEEGWIMEGTAVCTFEAAACELDYEVLCSSDWQTRSSTVKGWIGNRRVDFDISVTEDHVWICNGREVTSVAGCVDIDLGFSPSTNLLPVRRLSLAIGDSAEVHAAWLPFPQLSLQRLDQTYRRTGAGSYKYESRGGAFARTLDVSDVGFVTNYPGLWELESGLNPDFDDHLHNS